MGWLLGFLQTCIFVLPAGLELTRDAFDLDLDLIRTGHGWRWKAIAALGVAATASLLAFREGVLWWPVMAMALVPLIAPRPDETHTGVRNPNAAPRASGASVSTSVTGAPPGPSPRGVGGVAHDPTPLGRAASGGSPAAAGGVVPEAAVRRSAPRAAGIPGLTIDLDGKPLVANAPAALPFENELIKGEILFLMRTEPMDPTWAARFEGQQRQFEMQMTGQFKKLPQGTLFMGAELQGRPRIGMVTSRLVTMVMNFAARKVLGMHWSLGEQSYKATDAKSRKLFEAPHAVFPLECAMDKLVVSRSTGEHDRPPKLGGDLVEPDDVREERRSGRSPVEWELGPHYSFSFNSLFIDFVNWRCVNLPVGTVSLASVLGDQAIEIVVYDKIEESGRRPGHVGDNKRYFFRSVMSHDQEAADAAAAAAAAAALAGPGPVCPTAKDGDAVGDIDTGAGATAPPPPRPDSQPDPHRPTGTGDAEDCDDSDDDPERTSRLPQRSPSIADSVFVASNMVLPLIAGSVNRSRDARLGRTTTDAAASGVRIIADSRGYAVLREQALPMEVRMIKVGGSEQNVQNEILHRDDVVLVEQVESGKVLQILHHSWLGWSSSGATAPRARQSRKLREFVICELTGRDAGHDQLAVGQTFGLRSHRWPAYVVCVQSASSSKYGGHLLKLQEMSPRGVGMTRNASKIDPLSLCVQSLTRDVGPVLLQSCVDGDAASGADHKRVGGDDAVLQGCSKDSAPDMKVVVDVPAWVEMMNRKDRRPQLAYLLRVKSRADAAQQRKWVSLRTGGALSQVVQLQTQLQQQTQLKIKSTAPNNGVGREHVNLQPLPHQNTADQSVRMLSALLQELSLATTAGADDESLETRQGLSMAKAGLMKLLCERNELDSWFLRGGRAELGVTLPSRSGTPLREAIVARALWEGHWREECCILFATHLAFYRALSKKAKPAWILALHDIVSVRVLEEDSAVVFPGLYFLALDTVGRCHYVCFATQGLRDEWATALRELASRHPGSEVFTSVLVSDPREAFVLKSGQYRSPQRIILNARRLIHDMNEGAGAGGGEGGGTTPCELSQQLLKTVFALSPDSSTSALTAFLDATASLRKLDIRDMELNSREAMCFFINLFHTLLQHAFLLLGPPVQSEWATFVSTVSYELFGNVFSLLEVCVLRCCGALARQDLASSFKTTQIYSTAVGARRRAGAMRHPRKAFSTTVPASMFRTDPTTDGSALRFRTGRGGFSGQFCMHSGPRWLPIPCGCDDSGWTQPPAKRGQHALLGAESRD
jgi:hypothetical protein